MDKALQVLMKRFAAFKVSGTESLSLKSVTWAAGDLLLAIEVHAE